MDGHRVDAVGNLLEGNRSTRHGWLEFKETLVYEQRGVLNTRPAQDFFPEQDLVESRIHLGFFEAVPALLTGLGLFATFLALYLGLGGLQLPEGAGQIQGIPEFIEALSGKFLSSVLGLFTAVVFTLARSLLIPKAHQHYRRFCNALDSLFDRVTPEDLLRKLHIQGAEQSATLKHLATDISDRFREGMDENLRPPLERMIDLLQRSLEERRQTFEDMASKLAETFRSNFAQTTNFEFDRITDALEKTVTMVTRMEERSADSHRGFEGLIERLNQSTSELAGKLDSAATSLGTTQSEAREALDETVRQVLAANAQQTERSNAQMNEAMRSLQSSMSDVLESLHQAAGGLQEGGVQSQQKLLAAAEALADRVTNGATAATEAIAGTARTVMDENTEQASRIAQRLEALLERETGRSEVLTEQREAQNQAMERFARILSESKATLEGLQLASSGTRDAAQILQQAVGQVRQVQGEARSLIEASTSHTRDMRSVLSENQHLLDSYERVFRSVDEGLSKAVKALADELVRFQEDATAQLKRQLGVFDEHLGSATGKLGNAVQDLGDRLEEASETIGGALDRVEERRM